jgi:hypothetical protein
MPPPLPALLPPVPRALHIARMRRRRGALV